MTTESTRRTLDRAISFFLNGGSTEGERCLALAFYFLFFSCERRVSRILNLSKFNICHPHHHKAATNLIIMPHSAATDTNMAERLIVAASVAAD